MVDYTSHNFIGVDWGGLNVTCVQIYNYMCNWGRLGWINHTDILFDNILK